MRPNRAKPALPALTIQQTTTDEIFVTPTPERLRHANDNHVTVGGVTRMHDAPIDRLRRAGKIDDVQHAAGEHYRADWYMAGLAPLGAIDYGKVCVDGSKPTEVSDRRMNAIDRYNAATKRMGRNARVVDVVVLLEQNPETAGREIGYGNKTAAIAVAHDRLQAGLDELAKFYRLA